MILVTDVLSDFLPKAAWDFLFPAIIGGVVIFLVAHMLLKYVLGYDMLEEIINI